MSVFFLFFKKGHPIICILNILSPPPQKNIFYVTNAACKTCILPVNQISECKSSVYCPFDYLLHKCVPSDVSQCQGSGYD